MTNGRDETELNAIRQRNRVLFEGTVRSGRPRFSQQRNLIEYHAPPVRDGGHVAQESLEYAIGLAETEGDFDTVRRIVGATLKYQDLRPHSFSYGNWFWMDNWQTVRDPNAVSFMVPNYYHLLTRHREGLGDDLANQVLRALEPAGDALLAHRAQWPYSNIFITNILCKLQIGHLLDDARMRDLGYWDFEEWLGYTATFGVTEFNSPGYTVVQLNALECMLDVPACDAFHRQVERILRLYYTDMFLHYHPGTGRFAGTKMRAGGGAADNTAMHTLMYRQLGQPQPTDSTYNANMARSEYVLPDDVKSLAMDKALPLAIEMSEPYFQATRHVWMTPTYAVSSSTGGCHSVKDVPLEFLYGRPPRVSTACLLSRSGDYDLFCEQDQNVIVGAARWRFRPHGEPSPDRQASRLIDLSVGQRTGYVPADTERVGLVIRLAGRNMQPRVFVKGQPWNDQKRRLKASDDIVVIADDIYLGCRCGGRRQATLNWVDDWLTVSITIAAPTEPPWFAVQSLLMVIESKADSGAPDAFMQHMVASRLSSARRGDEFHLRGTYADRSVRALVPLKPLYLIKTPQTAIPVGRLLDFVKTDATPQ